MRVAGFNPNTEAGQTPKTRGAAFRSQKRVWLKNLPVVFLLSSLLGRERRAPPTLRVVPAVSISGFGFHSLPARLVFLAVLLVGFVVTPARLFGADFAVGQGVMSSGGGTSTNGTFSITGIIGQSDAGARLMGGVFAVEGGFWGAVTLLQTPGLPLSLQLLQASSTLVFSWPVTGETYVLESSPVVGPAAAWIPVSALVESGAQYRFVLLPQQPGQRYFRLRQTAPAP